MFELESSKAVETLAVRDKDPGDKREQQAEQTLIQISQLIRLHSDLHIVVRFNNELLM